MFRILICVFVVLAIATLLMVACSAPAAQPAATSGPTRASATSAAPTSAKEPTIDDIFPAGKERDLVLNNCTSCHNYTCIIKGQRAAGAWQTTKANHRDRVPAMSDGDYNAMFVYLVANFNDTKPEPRMPQELLQAGCPTQ